MNNTKEFFYKFAANYMIVIAIIILCIYSAIIQPVFLRTDNVFNIGRQMSSVGIAALGMTTIMIGGYIDLSMPGMFALISVVFCKVAGASANPWLAMIAAIITGLVAGLINGVVMIIFRARSASNMLFISFGMGMIFKSLATFINERVINLIPDPIFKAIGEKNIMYIPISFLIFFLTVIVMHIFLKHSNKGKSIYYLGCNYEGSRLVGINTKFIVLLIFAISGLLTGIASIVNISQVVQASTASGMNYEVNTISASVLGGTAFTGGRGGAFNTFFGTLMFVLLSNSLQLLGLSTYAINAVKGIILIAVILLDSRKEVLEARA